MNRFLTHEVGSLAKPPWLVKTNSGRSLDASDHEHAQRAALLTARHTDQRFDPDGRAPFPFENISYALTICCTSL